MINKLDIYLSDIDVKSHELPKKEVIRIHQMWIQNFASEVKNKTGKWRIGNHLWEGFASGIQHSFHGSKALEQLRSQVIEQFYVFEESGKLGFLCESGKYPELFNLGEDLYITPLDMSWTAVFCHDGVVYFAERGGKGDTHSLII